jgi:hypothetical protein
MAYGGEMTTSQRIAILEKAVAMARREVSVALLKVLATSAIGEGDERVVIGAHIQALKTIIDNATEELELLYEEVAEERDAQGQR